MNKILIIALSALLTSVLIIVRLIIIINDDEILSVSSGNGTYTINVVGEYADIYDCNMNSFVNQLYNYNAVIIPNHISSIQLQPYLVDKETYYNKIKEKMPFLCEVTEDAVQADINAVIFKSAVRNTSNQLAPHIIGYTLENKGVCGIEKAYNDFFRENFSINSVTFQVDARGAVLNGIEQKRNIQKSTEAGIITTLDMTIQQICESVFNEQNIECGAAVVMDIKTGEVKASVSYPDFDITNLAAYVDNKALPFLNRVTSSYSVGSIFKLVTAAAALEQGISSEFSYTCTGSININGQIFNCHKWGGHGEIDMNEAIVQSCNTYFIALSEYLDKDEYIKIASDLGFGQKIILCDSIISDAGNLQTVEEIKVSAELANMSFGQGRLLATPLQICRMTAAIANDGVINIPSLIKGVKYDDKSIDYNEISISERILSYKTVVKLKAFMRNVVSAENSYSAPDKTAAAGKTSTAQTGRFDEEGSELYNCWFTGFFPSYNPKYAVTVMIEGGVSGNRNAGPVFKQIADEIIEYEKKLRNN